MGEDDAGAGDELLTAPQLALALGRSHGTVHAWIQGRLLVPAGRVKRRNTWYWAYRLSDAKAVDAARVRRKRTEGARGELYGSVKPASGPTDSRPGSEERIEVYSLRVARGEAVFCPADVRLTDPDAEDRMTEAA